MNVDRLKPYHARPGRSAPPGPVSDPGQEGEYEVAQLLNRRTLHGRTHYLVRWQGHDSTADSWEPVEHLTHCQERIAEYEAAALRRPRTRRGADRGAPGALQSASTEAAALCPQPPAGWVLAPHGPLPRGARVLYWWPEDGWQLGQVVRPTSRPPFSHVVRYRRPEAAFAGEVDTLLDSSSYGIRWVLLAAAGS